jgi:hypothetical protein
METVDKLAMGAGTYDHIEHLDPMALRVVPVRVHPPPGAGRGRGVTFWAQSPPAALERPNAMALDGSVSAGGAHLSEPSPTH